jgi:hypothetical protein
MLGPRGIAFLGALLTALPAAAQSGLRLPERGEGLDPSFARGWLAPEYDRFGFAPFRWRDAYGFSPSPRVHWSYAFGERGSFSMSLASAGNAGREADEQRPLSLYGRYWFSPDWALSAESLSRDPTGLLRLQDFRIGVQRRF